MVKIIEGFRESNPSSKNSFADAIENGFDKKPKSIPPRYLYDQTGSNFFQEICDLKEYYLPNREMEVLRRSFEEIFLNSSQFRSVIEFGSGDSPKTQFILKGLLDNHPALTYVPIDVDQVILRNQSNKLENKLPGLDVRPIHGTYQLALDILNELHLSDSRLFLFLGSSIGNMKPNEASSFLRSIGDTMRKNDRLVVGYDRWKDPSRLYEAYNDSQNVTARFNENILRRINDELDGNFERSNFRHEAPVLEDYHRVEMRLISRNDQSVTIGALKKTYRFKAGDYIHTENSYKFTGEEFSELINEAGLNEVSSWTDRNDDFCVTLLRQR